uniref:5-hydroxytryptamine receptor 3C n=1 Tax=Equus caballus TaxID=9796 RepID=A0A3Q2HIN1_HORSE
AHAPWPRKGDSGTPLTGSLLSTGRGDIFTINCSGFDWHGVDPAVFQGVFARNSFRPVLDYNSPTHVNISFTLSAILEVVSPGSTLQWSSGEQWYHPFIRWNPEECGGIRHLSIATENLWLPDIFIKEFMDVDQTPTDLMAYVNSEGQIKYNKPMQVISICNLDIFYFPFDKQNCTFTFSSFIYPAERMVLGMEKEVQEILNMSQNLIQKQGEWVLLGIHQTASKMTVGTNQYNQIVFYLAIRRRTRLYIINLLVPSSFLITVDALSFYLAAENDNCAAFKITLLLGYNVFLLMMNDLLPASGTPLISVYFALCLSLMVVSLLETIFMTHLLHLATTQPPPMPRWLHSLLLYCTSSRRCYPTDPQKGNKGLGLTLQEDRAQKQHLVSLWVQFSHTIDTLLFRLYLLFLAVSVVMVVILWNT